MTDALLMSRSILPRAHQNACGTVGLLHALMNADNLENDGWLKKFADNTEGKDADGRADVLEGDTELDSCHSAAAEQGQVLEIVVVHGRACAHLLLGVRVRMLRAACAAGRAWGGVGAEREQVCYLYAQLSGFRL